MNAFKPFRRDGSVSKDDFQGEITNYTEMSTTRRAASIAEAYNNELNGNTIWTSVDDEFW
jgi:hypothetical protein